MEERDPNLSQAYRDAAHLEPSPALDARILDAARQAVAKSAVRRRPFWFAWAVPFTSVAVLVLGVTLLLDMQQRAPEVLESPTATPPAIRLDIPESSPTPAKPAEIGVPPRHEKAARPATSVARTASARSGSTPQAATTHSSEGVNEVLPQPFPIQPSPPFPPQQAAKAEAREAPKPAPAAAPEAARATGAAGSMADRSADTMSAPPPVMAPVRGGVPALGGALEKRMATEAIQNTPERMVETIRRLISEGRQDEARKVLDKLRRTYPGFELPEDLKGL